MKTTYLAVIALAERLHRRTLDLLQLELTRIGFEDLNASQAMILINMGPQEMSVGELTLRGCYQGSNVSYNLKKLVENGYIVQERSAADRRVVRVKLSERGTEVLGELDRFFERMAARVAGSSLDDEALASCGARLATLERFTVQQADRVSTEAGIGAFDIVQSRSGAAFTRA